MHRAPTLDPVQKSICWTGLLSNDIPCVHKSTLSVTQSSMWWGFSCISCSFDTMHQAQMLSLCLTRGWRKKQHRRHAPLASMQLFVARNVWRFEGEDEKESFANCWQILQPWEPAHQRKLAVETYFPLQRFGWKDGTEEKDRGTGPGLSPPTSPCPPHPHWPPLPSSVPNWQLKINCRVVSSQPLPRLDGQFHLFSSQEFSQNARSPWTSTL